MSTLFDLRTREGRRAEILDQVKTHGGFSYFWITENRLRALVGTEMVERKEIAVRNKQFPWSDVTLLPNAKMRDCAGSQSRNEK